MALEGSSTVQINRVPRPDHRLVEVLIGGRASEDNHAFNTLEIADRIADWVNASVTTRLVVDIRRPCGAGDISILFAHLKSKFLSLPFELRIQFHPVFGHFEFKYFERIK